VSEFVMPSFLDGNSAEEIMERMMSNLPEDIDDMPGGFPYDFCMPTALEKQDLVQYEMVECLQVMFSQFAWGAWLDLHARAAGIERKAAVSATATLRVYGDVGTEIPAGSVFCTAATDTTPSVEFATDSPAIITDEGYVDIPITAVEAGVAGNVRAETIIFLANNINGVLSAINPDAATGGADVESDDALRARIDLANGQEGQSFVANDTDYKRWALEVPGIGDAIVVPTWNGPGTVRLALIDTEGNPASEHLVQEVINHIISPNDRSARILPTGTAELSITPADTVQISYVCTGLIYDDTTTIEQIVEDFKTKVLEEYAEGKERGVLYYNQVRGRITEIAGVADFETFTMNGSEENIDLSITEYPSTFSVSFS